MNYVETKKGPMCGVGKLNNKYVLKILLGGSDETFFEITKEEFDLFPNWSFKQTEKIKERLVKQVTN